MSSPQTRLQMATLLLILAAGFSSPAQQPPLIDTQPASQTVVAGGGAPFTVTASGHKPLTYQWRFNEAVIDRATNATLLLGNVGAADAGGYSVIVSNTVGSITSVTAVLTVVFRPSIRQQPVSRTNAVGSDLEFS